MKKLTRRSYNRKLVIFGLALFMAFGMISTGFAAWVMSTASEANANAPVKVDTIVDVGFQIDIDQADDDGKWTANTALSFDAVSNDASGRVYFQKDGTDEDAGEVKTLTISGTVTNYNRLQSLNMRIEIPETLKKAIDYGFIKLVKPGTAEAVEIKEETVDEAKVYYFELDKTAIGLTADGDNGNNGKFSYTLTYVWGDFFAGMNPSEFYDNATTASNRAYKAVATTVEEVTTYDMAAETSTPKGADITDAQMTLEMKAFRSILTAGTNADVAYEGTIKIIVTASGEIAQ